MPELVDWRRDPAVARGARCATSKEWATHVHELWRVLARLDADDYDEDEDGKDVAGDAEAARTTSSRIRLPYPGGGAGGTVSRDVLLGHVLDRFGSFDERDAGDGAGCDE